MIRRVALLALTAIALPLAAQSVRTETPRPSLRELTLESIFDPKEKVSFSGAPQGDFVWLDDSTVTWPKTNEKSVVVEQSVVDVTTGKSRTLFAAAQLEAAARRAGANERDAAALTRTRSWNFSADHRSVLVTIGDDLYAYTFAGNELTRLSSSPGLKENPSFSPDGKRVAYVRGHDLYTVDVATQRERQLTTDGSADIYNGVLDWVYQEEIFGRGKFRAYWWSPDSSSIAFLRIDEHPVKRFTVVDHLPVMQELEETPYPKAGYPNPTVKLFTVAASGSTPAEVPTSRYEHEFLVVAVDWSPDGRLVHQVQNRQQTWLDLNVFDPHTRETKTLLHETTKAWVDNLGDPLWLADGSFLWLSERGGFRHIYHYSADGTLIRQITSGPWEARTLHGVDAAKHIYFSGTERSSIGGDVYSIDLDGANLRRISDAPGTHNATFNPSKTMYVDSLSSVDTPAQAAAVRIDGTRVRLIAANDSAPLHAYRFAKPEFVEVKTRDGFVMNAMLIKPPDFDPAKKYPVYEHTYSGPHAQQVNNAWGGSTYLWHQYLASKGIVVWICDNRSASGKGAESEWPIYKQLGVVELRDLEDGLGWLTAQPWVDGSRVLLNGWSYGGFMTSYALTHSTKWKAGVSGGTVTDWQNYDSVYTERFMLTPRENPDGYRVTAPKNAAKDLHGDLLLLHGTIDDNVHLQNTIQFTYELEKAGKPFEMMLYPKSRHGVTDPQLVAHMRQTMWRFVSKELLP
jgi:dipeptidyl-peptidase-4